MLLFSHQQATYMASVRKLGCLIIRRSHLHSKPAIKPFKDIPGPRGWPVIGSLPSVLRSGAMKRNTLHLYWEKRYKEFGKIYKEKIGAYSAVFLHDPDDCEYLIRNEGKYPERTEFKAWTLHRKDAGLDLGVFMCNGETWQDYRRALNKHLMVPKTVMQHTQAFCDVADDFISTIVQHRAPGGMVRDLETQLFYWAIESSYTLLLETRLGCFSKSMSHDMKQFIKAIEDVLRYSNELLIVPPEVARTLNLPLWKKHCAAWDTVFRIGKKYVDDRMTAVNEATSRSLPAEGLIATLMRSQQLTDDAILANLIDVMVGAVDTTSFTMQWALYLLARNPAVQQKLQEEVDRVIGGQNIGEQHIHQLPYLKAVIKETLRLFPVAPVIARILKEDIVIRQCQIPAGTIINLMISSMRHDPSLFKDPMSFKPERWLRDDRGKLESIHPFASIPFSFGARACIGRRIAELELYVLLGKLMQKFYVSQSKDKELHSVMKILLSPSEPLRLKFQDRDTASIVVPKNVYIKRA